MHVDGGALFCCYWSTSGPDFGHISSEANRPLDLGADAAYNAMAQ